VLDALRMALGQRHGGAESRSLHHSHRGSQCTSFDYIQALTVHGFLASVGSGRRRLRHSIRNGCLDVVRVGLTLAFDFAVAAALAFVHLR
jgi:hypothetical protein